MSYICDEIQNNISNYLDNELSENEKNEFLNHIDGCEECRKEFLEMKSIFDIVTSIEQVDLPIDFHKDFMIKLEYEKSDNVSEDKIFLPTDKIKKKNMQKFSFKKYFPIGLAAAASFIIFLISFNGFQYQNHNLSQKDFDIMYDEIENGSLAEAYYPSNPQVASGEIPEFSYENDSISSKAKRSYIKNEIKSYTLFLEVENKSDAINKIKTTPGYTTMSDIYSSSFESSKIIRNVPAESIDEILSELKSIGTIKNFSEIVENISDAKLRLNAELSAKRLEVETLSGFLKESSSLEVLNYIDSRLSELYLDINSIEGNLRYYNSAENSSIINISIKELNPETASSGSLLERISVSFKNSISFLITILSELVLFIAYNWIFVLIIVLILTVFISIKKRRRRNLEKK